MKKISMICMAAGMACTATALAKPPLSLDTPQYAEPIMMAKARIVDGQIKVIGDVMPYRGHTTRNYDKGLFYQFDSMENYYSSSYDTTQYVNNANGGAGSTGGRSPSNPVDACFTCDGCRYIWNSTTYYIPVNVEDVTSLGCFDEGGQDIDSLDTIWHKSVVGSSQTAQWIGFFASDDPAGCGDGDPSPFFGAHTWKDGVLFGFAPNAGFWYTNLDGVSDSFSVPGPASGGAICMILGQYLDTTTNTIYLDTNGGTFFGMWCTGDATGSTYHGRPGSSSDIAWDDDNPTDGDFTTGTSGECYSYAFGICVDPLQKAVAFGQLRCAGDVNNDGYVNGNDFDAFASAFETLGDPCGDFNHDGYVNGNDYDAFASFFEQPCP